MKSEKTNNSLLKDVYLTGSPPCHLLWSMRAIQLFHQSTPALPALLWSGAAAWVHLSLLCKQHWRMGWEMQPEDLFLWRNKGCLSMVPAGSLMSSIYPVIHWVWECGILGPSAGKESGPQMLASLATFTTAVASIPKKNVSLSALFPQMGILRWPPIQTPAISFPKHFQHSHEAGNEGGELLEGSCNPTDFWCISTQYGVHSALVAFFPPHQTYVQLFCFLLPSLPWWGRAMPGRA